jgi:hypothetical protein
MGGELWLWASKRKLARPRLVADLHQFRRSYTVASPSICSLLRDSKFAMPRHVVARSPGGRVHIPKFSKCARSKAAGAVHVSPRWMLER